MEDLHVHPGFMSLGRLHCAIMHPRATLIICGLLEEGESRGACRQHVSDPPTTTPPHSVTSPLYLIRRSLPILVGGSVEKAQQQAEPNCSCEGVLPPFAGRSCSASRLYNRSLGSRAICYERTTHLNLSETNTRMTNQDLSGFP